VIKMWLIILMLSAVISTAIWYISDEARKTYRIGILNLILWGTSLMVLVDHVAAYFEEGEFFDTSPDAMLLSSVLIMAALLVWEIVLLIKDPKGVIKSQR